MIAHDSPWKALRAPFIALFTVFVLGSLGYYVVGIVDHKAYSLLDSAYMTSITLTTVGYGDPLGVTNSTVGKLYTMGVAVLGMGVTLYAISAVTAFTVEGHLGQYFRGRRMERDISRLRGHTIICGAGRTGRHVIDEHDQLDVPYVVVDSDEARAESVLAQYAHAIVHVGNATEEETLRAAGIEHAKALVCALPDDAANLYLLVTARFLRPELNIIVRILDHDAEPKFRAAGATSVVSPTYLGGLRLAAQVLQPRVVDFLDGMLRTTGDTLVYESTVQPDSELVGQTLASSGLQKRVGLLVVAMRQPGETAFTYSPAADVVIEAASVLVVIGPRECARRLAALTKDPS